MKLSNTKFEYNENGAFVQVNKLLSCDIAFSGAPSRSNWERSGTYTNETIDTITINFERGYNILLDGIKRYAEIQLRWNNGAYAYAGIFIVADKINTKQPDGKTISYISFEPKDDAEISMLARGGEGGHVDDVELTDSTGTRSVVSSGVAEINLTGYAKKADIEKEYVKSATSVTTGQKVYVREAGIDKTINYGSGVDLGSGTLVLRAPNAQVKVPDTPAADGDATSKKYVDDKAATKIDKDPDSASFKIGYDAGGIYIIK